MFLRTFFFLILITVLISSLLSAQTEQPTFSGMDDILLYVRIPEKEAASLDEETMKLYNSALAKLDRINKNGAIDDLMKAVERQPDFLTAQAIIAKLSTEQGDLAWGKDAKLYYGNAIKAYEKILEFKPESSFYQAKLRAVKSSFNRVDQRYDKQVEIGLEYLKKNKYVSPKDAEEDENEKWTVYTRKNIEFDFGQDKNAGPGQGTGMGMDPAMGMDPGMY